MIHEGLAIGSDPAVHSASDRSPWWRGVKSAEGVSIDPVVWAPWALLAREAQFGIEKGGRWMVHVPSMSLVTWPDHRALRAATLERYELALRRLVRAGADELGRRRAMRALERPQATLGVLRAIEVMAEMVPNRIAIQVPASADGRPASWCYARLASTPVPAAPEL